MKTPRSSVRYACVRGLRTHGALGVANFKADGCNPGDLRRVELLPFADEDCTLTYFRAPDIEEDVTDEDELFGPHSAGECAGTQGFNK